MIPTRLLSNWHNRALAQYKHDNLGRVEWARLFCEVRDTLAEIRLENRNAIDGGDRRSIGEAEVEAAKALLVPESTLRDKMTAIAEFSFSTLEKWLLAGITWQHLDCAREWQTDDKHPADLINDAITLGSSIGDRVMTVEELRSHATGGKYNPVEHRFRKLISSQAFTELPRATRRKLYAEMEKKI